MLRTFLALAALALTLTACDSDDDGPEGTYNAVVFSVDLDGTTVDVLDEGGDLSLDLDADGSFTGSLLIPDDLLGDDELDESLSGTYLVTGTTVRFTSDDDTFIRDATWTLDGDELATSYSEIEVVLEK